MDAPVLDHPATKPTATDEPTSPVEVPKAYPALTAKDRCESPVSKILRDATNNRECGAQAFMRAVVTEDSHLLFCAHHGRVQMPALAEAGIRVVDESGQINAKPTDASASNGF